MVAAAVGIGVAAAGIGSAVIGGNASSDAADSQAASASEGVAEQRRQFDALQALFKPYVTAGTGALTGQQNLLGLNGNAAQQTAITGLQDSAQFKDLTKQGENAILQNASATGGLRGGNTQGALAQFRPALLSQLIDQQYNRLGGITSLGQNAAAGQGNAGMQTGTNIANLLQQQGAAVAGGQLAQGQAWQNGINSITQGLGAYVGAGGKF